MYSQQKMENLKVDAKGRPDDVCLILKSGELMKAAEGDAKAPKKAKKEKKEKKKKEKKKKEKKKKKKKSKKKSRKHSSGSGSGSGSDSDGSDHDDGDAAEKKEAEGDGKGSEQEGEAAAVPAANTLMAAPAPEERVSRTGRVVRGRGQLVSFTFSHPCSLGVYRG